MQRLAVAVLPLAVIAALALTHASQSAPPTPKASAIAAPGLEVATFAGGCFWSMEYAFDKVDGVRQTVSGFMGGKTPNPTYAEVSHGIRATPRAYRLPTIRRSSAMRSSSTTIGITSTCSTAAGSSAIAATNTDPSIFAHTPEQKQAAADSKAKLDASHRFSTPIAVPIADAGPFTAAEDNHQNFHNTNTHYYKRYRAGCGHDRRLRKYGARRRTRQRTERRRAEGISSCAGRTRRRSPASASAVSCRSAMARRRRRDCSDRRCRRRRIPPAPGR